MMMRNGYMPQPFLPNQGMTPPPISGLYPTAQTFYLAYDSPPIYRSQRSSTPSMNPQGGGGHASLYQQGTPVAGQTSIMPGTLPMEQSYIENILRLNLGKQATIYMTFEGNSEWNAKIFKGVLEAAGRDHIIISDRETGKRYLLLMVNLDYITFDEQLNYTYPYQTGYGSGTSTRQNQTQKG